MGRDDFHSGERVRHKGSLELGLVDDLPDVPGHPGEALPVKVKWHTAGASRVCRNELQRLGPVTKWLYGFSADHPLWKFFDRLMEKLMRILLP